MQFLDVWCFTAINYELCLSNIKNNSIGVSLPFFFFFFFLFTENLSTDSFLLNHSAAYNAAAVASWVEFFAEVYFLGDFKSGLWAVSVLGLVICAVGEVLRKSAMVQAGRSFNHVVQVSVEQWKPVIVVTRLIEVYLLIGLEFTCCQSPLGSYGKLGQLVPSPDLFLRLSEFDCSIVFFSIIQLLIAG